MGGFSGNSAVSSDRRDEERPAGPGGVQSTGLVIAVDLSRLCIGAVSENAADVLGRPASELIGQSAKTIFGNDEADRLHRLKEDRARDSTRTLRSRRLHLFDAVGDSREFDCLTHRTGDFVVLELFDPANILLGSADDRAKFRDLLFADVEGALHIPELCRNTAQRMRDGMSLSGVGVYAFDPAGNGHLVAGASDGAYEFPERGIRAARLSDRVRRPLERLRIRLVSNADGEPARLVSLPESDGRIDLSNSLLRAFSLEDEGYLEDFVPAQGFLVMPIIVDRRLWGIILCLDVRELRPPLVDLRLFSFATQVMSTGVARLEAAGRLEAFRAIRDIADRVKVDAGEGLSTAALLKRHGDDILARFGSDQGIVKIGGEQFAFGRSDGAGADLSPLAAWAENDIAVIDERSPPDARASIATTGNAEGVWISLSDEGDDYIFFGRRDTALTRADVAPWRPLSARAEIEAVQPLRRAITMVLGAERTRALEAARRESEVRNARMRIEMLNANRHTTISELAGSLAHEMNQPLTAIMNFVKASQVELRNSNADVSTEIMEMMDEAVDQAARAGEILSRLRRFVERAQSERERLDLSELMQHASTLTLETSNVKNIAVEYRLDPDLPPIEGDRLQLEQLVFNLVRNAAEALERFDDRRIAIRTQREGERHIRATVSDSGPGVPPSARKKLFEPFADADGRGKGTGIGLSICRKIVEAHGGHIEYRRRNRMTEFVVILPTVAEEEPNE